jgi:hypothetical protein
LGKQWLVLVSMDGFAILGWVWEAVDGSDKKGKGILAAFLLRLLMWPKTGAPEACWTGMVPCVGVHECVLGMSIIVRLRGAWRAHHYV